MTTKSINQCPIKSKLPPESVFVYNFGPTIDNLKSEKIDHEKELTIVERTDFCRDLIWNFIKWIIKHIK